MRKSNSIGLQDLVASYVGIMDTKRMMRAQNCIMLGGTETSDQKALYCPSVLDIIGEMMECMG